MGGEKEDRFLEAPDSLEKMIKQFIVPLAKNNEAKDGLKVVSLLKALAYCYSMSEIDRPKICGEIVDKFQEYDSNIYSLIINRKVDGEVKNHEYYICYRIADKDFLESVIRIAISSLSTDKVRFSTDKVHIDKYGAMGAYGGIGFGIAPKPKENK